MFLVRPDLLQRVDPRDAPAPRSPELKAADLRKTCSYDIIDVQLAILTELPSGAVEDELPRAATTPDRPDGIRRVQFERLGYFCADPDSDPSEPGAPATGRHARKLVFNRTVTLRDTWAKIAKKQRNK